MKTAPLSGRFGAAAALALLAARASLTAAAAVAAGSATPAAPAIDTTAPVIDTTLHFPVHGNTSTGAVFALPMTVRVVREDAPDRRPFLILLHGRAADPASRGRLTAGNYPANSRYFAGKGFVVLIPLRVGYGATGGPDAEDTGDCTHKRYAEGVAPAVAETAQLLAFAATLPGVDAARGIIVGESFGGLVAIAAAAAHLPGVVGAVNVSGGDGGDSAQHPDAPCQPDLLQNLFARYGTRSRIDTLWMYSANDRLWGPQWPRAWFAAFTGAGGLGSFEALPADKNNGHFIFNRNAEAWHAPFERFIAALGLRGPAR